MSRLTVPRRWVDRSLLTSSLSAVLLAHALASTTFFADFRNARVERAEGDYRALRESGGCAGFPIEAIRDQLNRRFPERTPVALQQGIFENHLLHQRLVERLYPRPVDQSAPMVIEVGTSAGTPLSQWRGSPVSLRGGPTDAAGPPLPPEPLQLSWPHFALSCVSVIGWGILLATAVSWWRTRRASRLRVDLSVPSVVLSAAALLAMMVTIATWVQLRISWRACSLLGVVSAVIVPLLVVKRKGTIVWPRPRQLWRRPETLGLGALLSCTVWQMARLPVIVWDGRSIWLFHLKQVFFRGRFAKSDILHPDFQWSHGEYPLQMAAWLAQFSALEPTYDERMASLGYAALFAAQCSALWVLSRQRMGRWGGAGFVLALFFYVQSGVTSGYADTPLTLFLLLGILALPSPRTEVYGTLALLSASLTKREGMIYASAILAFHVASKWRTRPWRQRLLPLAALLPAVLHALYFKALHVPDTYEAFDPKKPLAEAAVRLQTITDSLAPQANLYPIAWAGYAGAIVFVALALEGRRSGRALMAIWGAVACLAFAYGAMLFTPYDLHWHIDTAMGRLLGHPAALAVAAPLILSGSGWTRRLVGATAPRAQ